MCAPYPRPLYVDLGQHSCPHILCCNFTTHTTYSVAKISQVREEGGEARVPPPPRKIKKIKKMEATFTSPPLVGQDPRVLLHLRKVFFPKLVCSLMDRWPIRFVIPGSITRLNRFNKLADDPLFSNRSSH